MGQSAILLASLLGPNGTRQAGRVNAQGLLLLGRQGATYYVDETDGDDTQANAGGPFSPFATLAAANAVAVAGDTIYIVGTVHVSATVVFSQNNLQVIGLNAPSNNCRARISQTGSTVFSPLVSVTGQGCRFENLGTFHGFADASAQVCWADSGGRNYYENVDFMGGGNATAAAQAGCRSLVLSGSTGENYFKNCGIGLDTVARATNSNATLEMSGASPRNTFDRCRFQMLSSLAGNFHVLVGSGGIDRWAEFIGCRFYNAVNSTGTTITADFSVHASAGGACVLDPTCISYGATKISAAGPVIVGGVVPTAGTSSLGVTAS